MVSEVNMAALGARLAYTRLQWQPGQHLRPTLEHANLDEGAAARTEHDGVLEGPRGS